MEEIKIRALSFSYPEREEKALYNIDLTVNAGDFLVLCGPSGCGKTTLLRHLKRIMAPHVELSCELLFKGRPIGDLSLREQSSLIGFVTQNPDDQIVTDKVWHELAFGLESLGLDTPTVRRRVAEMASFFGIEDWFYKNVCELSGGQKQLLNLASVMVMQPEVLVLDEPTGQLDPIAASDFIGTLGKINRELGTTVVLSEHRLEDAFPLSTSVAVLDGGRIAAQGAPAAVAAQLLGVSHKTFLSMPAAMRVWAAVDGKSPCPVTVRDGRDWFSSFAEKNGLSPLPPEEKRSFGETVIKTRELWFRYEKNAPDIIRGATFEVKKGEFTAVLGGNGAGKSTLLKLLCGILKPYRGKVTVTEKASMLPQDPQALFFKDTVIEDLKECSHDEKALSNAVRLCRLSGLLDRHPYDLSGGEQQRAALAKLILSDPDILLLDEPTKGLDAEFKASLAKILGELTKEGKTVVCVSHDAEFCAEYAHRCIMLFDGNIAAEGAPREFFSGNSFYTTAANRMVRERIPEAVTVKDVISCCGKDHPYDPQNDEREEGGALGDDAFKTEEKRALPLWRRIPGLFFGALSAFLFFKFVNVKDLTGLVSGEAAVSARALLQYAAFLLSFIAFAALISRKSQRRDYSVKTPESRRKLSKRTLCAAVLILLLIPLTLYLGQYFTGGRRYYLTALLVLIECTVPFFLIFESRRPQARELVVIAVLCAVGVAGRAVFFMLPQFKPVLAVTVIAGVAFGGETGFLVGAVTMLVSNMIYSQGPWTPWQMFAMGIIGFLAGVLFRKGVLARSKWELSLFGALSAIFIYGGIMNPASALMYSAGINKNVLLTYYVTGFPMDCVHAFATALFLWIAAEPMLKKLDRIKVKYGIVEG
ncbi:MAG: ATP-binding cassette domain-containing protein [Clostridia bacterium]|nr:ATP-binding cassette domain-containing protein [Clostridia bacterium]